MKAKMTKDGDLTIAPESELEEFALNAWYNRYIDKDDYSVGIIIEPIKIIGA